MWRKRNKNIFSRVYRTVRGWLRSKKVIYLAHSVYEQKRGKKLETRLSKMGFRVINPFDKEPDGGVSWSGSTSKEIGDWIIKADYDSVDESDMIVCIFPNRRTVGIPCEMTYAWYNYIPVYSFTPEDMKGHPWIVGMSERIFIFIDSLLSYIVFKH